MKTLSESKGDESNWEESVSESRSSGPFQNYGAEVAPADNGKIVFS